MATTISKEARERAAAQLKANGPLKTKPAADDHKAAVKKAAADAKAAKAAKAKTPEVDPEAAKLKAKEEAAAVKAAAKAKREKELADAKAKRDAEKAADSATRQAEYKARIELQKATTAERHRKGRLFNSFLARVKYALYMDNPALGGLEGKEALGWALKYASTTGAIYTVERIGLTIHLNEVPKGGKLTPVASIEDATEAQVLGAVKTAGWAA